MSSTLDTNQHRLRRIYDDYRTAQMNRDYYACRLETLKTYNRYYEIAIAIGTSTAVAGWHVWQTPAGKTVWAFFGALVAVLTIVKPILQLAKDIERYSKLHTGYSDLFYDYRHIIDEVKARGGINKQTAGAAAAAEKRYRDLALQDDPKPLAKLVDECFAAIEARSEPFDKWRPVPAGVEAPRAATEAGTTVSKA